MRYLAVDFGRERIRVNAISAGPIRTLAGAGIGDARAMFAFQQKHSPLGRGVTLDELGGAALYLLSDLSTGVTGEIHFVDSGYNVISMPHPDTFKGELPNPVPLDPHRPRRPVALRADLVNHDVPDSAVGKRGGNAMSPRELGAEFIGTFTLVTAVCGAALFSAPSAGLVAVAFAVGLSVLAMAFAVGPISGGHFNPAVTLGLVAGGRFETEQGARLTSSRRCSAARRRHACSTSSSCGAAGGKWNSFTDASNLYGGDAFVAGRGRPDRGRHHGAVPDRHHGRDDEELPGRLRADRDRPCADAHSPRRDPGLECLAQSGPLDRNRDLRRARGLGFALAVLGRADRRRRDRRHRRRNGCYDEPA